MDKGRSAAAGVSNTSPVVDSYPGMHRYHISFRPSSWPYDWAAPKHGLYLHTFLLSLLYQDGCLRRVAGQESAYPGKQLPAFSELWQGSVPSPSEQIQSVENSVTEKQLALHRQLTPQYFSNNIANSGAVEMVPSSTPVVQSKAPPLRTSYRLLRNEQLQWRNRCAKLLTTMNTSAATLSNAALQEDELSGLSLPDAFVPNAPPMPTQSLVTPPAASLFTAEKPFNPIQILPRYRVLWCAVTYPFTVASSRRGKTWFEVPAAEPETPVAKQEIQEDPAELFARITKAKTTIKKRLKLKGESAIDLYRRAVNSPPNPSSEMPSRTARKYSRKAICYGVSVPDLPIYLTVQNSDSAEELLLGLRSGPIVTNANVAEDSTTVNIASVKIEGSNKRNSATADLSQEKSSKRQSSSTPSIASSNNQMNSVSPQPRPTIAVAGAVREEGDPPATSNHMPSRSFSKRHAELSERVRNLIHHVGPTGAVASGRELSAGLGQHLLDTQEDRASSIVRNLMQIPHLSSAREEAGESLLNLRRSSIRTSPQADQQMTQTLSSVTAENSALMSPLTADELASDRDSLWCEKLGNEVREAACTMLYNSIQTGGRARWGNALAAPVTTESAAGVESMSPMTALVVSSVETAENKGGLFALDDIQEQEPHAVRHLYLSNMATAVLGGLDLDDAYAD